VLEPVEKVAFNSLELELPDIKIVSQFSGDEIPIQYEFHDFANEQVIMYLLSPLQQGTYYLKLSFNGTIVDKPNGLYSNKYIKYCHLKTVEICILYIIISQHSSVKGEERFNAVTQFEPTFARRVFPCWDEPALRATFDIKLIVPKGHVALSNMVYKSL
jgi:aminopeptidase N